MGRSCSRPKAEPISVRPLCLVVLSILCVLALATPARADVTATDRAHAHEQHGHQQYRHGHGTEGHTWAAYQREARQINAYARAVALNELARCSRDVECGLRLSSFLRHGPYRLARAIGICESGLNPNAQNGSSSAAGVFQFVRGTWLSMSARYGHGGASVFDPWANVDTAVQVLRDGGSGHWAASQGCWG